MKTKQLLVVAYDISNDKRRTKLHNTLLDFGSPVQYSVFECILDSRGIEKLKARVEKIIKPRLDHVRYYFLCASCMAKVEASNGRVSFGSEDEAMIV